MAQEPDWMGETGTGTGGIEASPGGGGYPSGTASPGGWTKTF